MNPFINPLGKKYLLVWRTESIFFNAQRRQLSNEWTLVRVTSLPYPIEPNLVNSNLKKRLPFADNTFDAIYSFHVVEHQNLEEVRYSLHEMKRVLKPGGILRISTPDIEFFVREYLNQLENCIKSPNDDAFQRYEWAFANVLDQAVRQKSGGKMAQMLFERKVSLQYLKELNGDSLNFIVYEKTDQSIDRIVNRTYFDGSPATWFFWVQKLFFGVLRKIIVKLPFLSPMNWINERNLWLYDRISLPKLCEEIGFSDSAVRDFANSAIESWNRYDFDKSIYGNYPLEPSLFVEARK